MKVNINVEKKYFLGIVAVIVILAGAFGVYAVWDSAKTVYHNAGDVKVNIGGQDYSLQEAINNNLIGGGSTSGINYLEYRVFKRYINIATIARGIKDEIFIPSDVSPYTFFLAPLQGGSIRFFSGGSASDDQKVYIREDDGTFTPILIVSNHFYQEEADKPLGVFDRDGKLLYKTTDTALPNYASPCDSTTYTISNWNTNPRPANCGNLNNIKVDFIEGDKIYFKGENGGLMPEDAGSFGMELNIICLSGEPCILP